MVVTRKEGLGPRDGSLPSDRGWREKSRESEVKVCQVGEGGNRKKEEVR